MRVKTTEASTNVRPSALFLVVAAALAGLIGCFIKDAELKQRCFSFGKTMALSVALCYVFYLVFPGWFKSRWKQPQ